MYLNKGEARHALARAVFAHSQGRIATAPTMLSKGASWP